MAFDDERWGLLHSDLLAQRVNYNGTLGGPTKHHPPLVPGIDSPTQGQISYVLEQAGPVRIRLFDLLGRQVALLEDDWREAGTYRLPWNDEGLASGIYLLRMEIGGRVQVRKVTVVR